MWDKVIIRLMKYSRRANWGPTGQHRPFTVPTVAWLHLMVVVCLSLTNHGDDSGPLWQVPGTSGNSRNLWLAGALVFQLNGKGWAK